jgi:uncharacterized protein (TIGR02118 family)
VAQAFHWFDAPLALAECARVLRPAGGLALVWNERDESELVVVELTRISKWDVHQPYPVGVDFGSVIDASGAFGPMDRTLFRFTQELDRKTFVEQVGWRTRIAVPPEDRRRAILDDVAALAVGRDEPILQPYIAHTFCARVASNGRAGPASRGSGLPPTVPTVQPLGPGSGRHSVTIGTHHYGRATTMIKLTCLLRRKEGLTPAEFHAYWRDHHGPLIANSSAAKYVIRYEQNGRPLDDYRDVDDRSGYDGVTVQWFESMNTYYAHMDEDDFPAMMADIAKFLDTDCLEVVLTEEPRIIIDGHIDWSA